MIVLIFKVIGIIYGRVVFFFVLVYVYVSVKVKFNLGWNF